MSPITTLLRTCLPLAALCSCHAVGISIHDHEDEVVEVACNDNNDGNPSPVCPNTAEDAAARLAAAVDDADENESDDNAEPCSLYLAPSSIPGAGWGLYTGIDLDAGDDIGPEEMEDVVVEIEDAYKTLPYRGQQRFLSWLGYIWPSKPNAFYHSSTESFPLIPDARYPFDGLNSAQGVQWMDEETEERRISAFAPGVASTANSHWDLHNVIPASPGENRFIAMKYVAAGSELFLNYGGAWHEWYDEWAAIHATTDYETLEDYNRKMDYSNLPTEADKRAQMDQATRRKRKDVQGTDVFKPFGAVERKLDETMMRETETEPEGEDEPVDEAIRSLEWLQQHGVCADNLEAGEPEDEEDEVGAFTTRFIRQGQIIAPAPLLTLKREDLDRYEFREEEVTQRNALNFNNYLGKEELLNLCYGHPDSELLLLPYSPGVSFIRHSSEAPNAKIRWSAGQEDLLKLHPVDVLELSGKLRMEFVALRDIDEDEEVLVDFGSAYENAWDEDEDDVRHERGVPAGFYPDHWLHASVKYEVDLPKLQPGEMKQLVWKHNGQPVANAYRVGLPPGFSEKVLQYSKDLGIMDRFEDVLYKNTMESDDWVVFDARGEDNGEWFAQRFMSTIWNFNMHYIAMWSETARKSFLRAMYGAGFQTALEAVGREFGLESLTCFHGSFMGISEADSSFTHTDIYATGNKGFNIIFPTVTVPDSAPELDIQSDDPNIVIRVHYEHDTAIVQGDWVYHKTSPIDYNESRQMRIVVGQYCAEVTPENQNQIANIYDGEDPAPFCDSWLNEIHWSGDGKHSLNVQ